MLPEIKLNEAFKRKIVISLSLEEFRETILSLTMQDTIEQQLNKKCNYNHQNTGTRLITHED